MEADIDTRMKAGHVPKTVRGRTFLDVYAERIAAQEESGERPPCTPNSTRCYSAKMPNVRTRDCCRSWIATILRDVGTALDEREIPWFIDYGTLLGYMVDGSIYWNDKDSDIGVPVEYMQHVIALMDVWRRMGYDVSMNMPRGQRFKSGGRIKVRLSHLNHTNCDIFFWHEHPHAAWLAQRHARSYHGECEVVLDRQNYIPDDRFKGREFPREWLYPLQRGTFEGFSVSVPARPDLLIAHRYGEDWNRLEEVSPKRRHPRIPR